MTVDEIEEKAQLAAKDAEIERLRLIIVHEADRTEAADDEAMRRGHTIEELRAVLRNALCPGGGYTGQPDDEYPNVDACLKAGVCGCDIGAVIKEK